MLGFALFLVAVCAVGFVYLFIDSRWKTITTNGKVGFTHANIVNGSIKAQKIDLKGVVVAKGVITSTRTLPQPDELVTQLAGVSTVETVEQAPRYTPTVSNSHWHRHTFERPRKKRVKR